MECRLIVDQPADGAWNMAVDQALLESVASVGQPVLRLYRWSQPTLSLGYFQSHGQRHAHRESGSCPMLRRSTGGGAIIHDRELTYSLILPATVVTQPTVQFYDRVHQLVAKRLRQFQLSAALHPDIPAPGPNEMPSSSAPTTREHSVGGGPEQTAGNSAAFLCFQRRAAGDLVLWPPAAHPAERVGYKVLGSAQRKWGGSVLQHGSLLVERSPSAPQLPGINDFLPRDRQWDYDSLTVDLTLKLAAEFGWNMTSSKLTTAEQRLAQSYQKTRFANDAWNLAR